MDDHNLERLIDYINTKNKESVMVVITPRKVFGYYRKQKDIDPQKAFHKTLLYIDDKLRGS